MKSKLATVWNFLQVWATVAKSLPGSWQKMAPISSRGRDSKSIISPLQAKGKSFHMNQSQTSRILHVWSSLQGKTKTEKVRISHKFTFLCHKYMMQVAFKLKSLRINLKLNYMVWVLFSHRYQGILIATAWILNVCIPGCFLFCWSIWTSVELNPAIPGRFNSVQVQRWHGLCLPLKNALKCT